MPLLGHATPVIRQSLARTAVKVKTPARFSHDHHGPEETVPFNFRSRLFGAKVVVYLATGFGLPFFAAWYQLKKAGGSA